MSDSSSPFGDARNEPVSTGFDSSVWRNEVSTDVEASTQRPPLLTPGAQPVAVLEEVQSGRVPASLLAGAVAALVGGLVWAGVVIATKLDIGILAWLVGGATGMAIVRVAGGQSNVASRVLAGAFAAVGIMVGKYVIFVHAVKVTIAAQFAGQGLSISYLDTRQMSFFLHHFGSIVRPIYALWVGLALVAAFRTAGGQAAFGRRRR